MMQKIMTVLKMGVGGAGAALALCLLFFGMVRKMWRKVFGQKRSGPAKTYKDKKPESISPHRPKQQEDNRGEQVKRLVDLRMKADQAEAEMVYSKLFGEIGLAIQKLFALAKEEEERGTYRRILVEEIQLPIQEAFESFQVTFVEAELSLPIRQAEPEPGLMARLEKLSVRELVDAARECERRIERAKIYEIPKGAVNRAAGSLRRLIKTPAEELDWRKMKALAAEIEKAFRDSGIYPLFRRDRRILERPDLCTLFIEVRGNALIWPGLFIEIDGKLQMYGNFQGTCQRGEWE